MVAAEEMGCQWCGISSLLTWAGIGLAEDRPRDLNTQARVPLARRKT